MAFSSDFFNRRKKTLRKIEKKWGAAANEAYTSEDWKTIASYFQATGKERSAQFRIDDITWSDLELNDIFRRLNHTLSSTGEEFLYCLFREPLFSGEEVNDRESLISFFSSHPEQRAPFQLALGRLGKNRSIEMSEWLFNDATVEPSGMLPVYLFFGVLPILSLLVSLFWKPGLILLALSFVVNLALHYHKKFIHAPQFEILNRLAAMVACAGDLSKIKIQVASSGGARLRQNYHRVRRMHSKYFRWSIGGGGTDTLIEYVDILLLRECIAYEIYARLLRRHRHTLQELYRTIGFFDSMLAIASYRDSLPYRTNPQLTVCTHIEGLQLDFSELAHPLLENPVGATLKCHRLMLITGSNASGKSTFLKTVAVNAIMAQTIVTVFARRYAANYFKVLSSMALRDNIQNGESYFIVEAKSMKRLIEQSAAGAPCLCLIDEVLRGTNTVERIAAATALLRFLSGRFALCIAATHDHELAHRLEGVYQNHHFCEEIIDGRIHFDYLIKPGLNTRFNALKILKLLGFPPDMLKNAEMIAAHFSEDNSQED